jgi:S-DNA-T family DNA segregation ATPase FtsK/SpoIIIE
LYESEFLKEIVETYNNSTRGAGGMVGFFITNLTESISGRGGSYLILSALGVIGLLMLFNVTLLDILARIRSLFSLLSKVFARKPKNTKKPRPKVEEVLSKIEAKTKGKIGPIANLGPLPNFLPMEKTKDEPDPVKVKADKPEPKLEESKKANKKELKSRPVVKREKGKEYQLPPLTLLAEPSQKELEKEKKLKETTEYRKRLLEEALKNFGIGAQIVDVNQGPAVTRFEVQPDPGVKVSKIVSIADDIALNLAAQGVRIEAPIPGKSAIGIEVPNATVTSVRLKEIVKINDFQRSTSKLFIALGKDLSGSPIYGDLSKMPHLLIAGTTGSGKSVCINALIISILLRAKPNEVKFIMIDPKRVELSMYDGIPHLLTPVVIESKKAASALKNWVMQEMERRYKLFFESGARNIAGYNAKIGEEEKLPFIVVIIDELADLMMVAASDVESSICRLAQMARATGIHLVVATQRPSVDVITGLIKANIPSRIAFAVATQIDSRVILDSSGAEKLLGRGDMLYSPVGALKTVRLQGSFVSDAETERVIEFIKKQESPEYIDDILSSASIAELESSGSGQERDALFNEAVKILIQSGQASTSHLQRRLRIGYNRAARLMDEIEAAGIVSKSEGENKARRIIATAEILQKIGI